VIIFPLLIILLALVAGLYLAGPTGFRPALAIAGLIATGVVLGLSPLELGLYGVVLAAVTLVALLVVPSST
jgi:hypothetical protein